ncbi:hypothetical protein IZ6_18960 [Terrihabitans soli]|uniref:GSCFA domain-containing protein n=1 Tax=Terrihabitans soli TaxID=708113 RepID=A0A6S6QVS4_9HYPH|nr:GSCFA domain-containing protein [Terrihabitans soli]BCJ91161.1 hypothetical protein IZ6_18960 [Terrihabitans soli]
MNNIGAVMKRLARRCRVAAASIIRPTFNLVATERANARFGQFADQRKITIQRRPIFTKNDVFFAMGSCFAEEIRKALTGKRIECVPHYKDVAFAENDVSAPELKNDHLSYYNTFSVRLQLEQALGLWRQDAGDYWLTKRSAEYRVPWEGGVYQDPYKRVIRAADPENLTAVIDAINAETARGFQTATAFLFTFGMTEVFINRKSGKVVCQKPSYGGGGGADETELHVSSFEENLDNVLAIVDLIRARKPDAPIVMSVSPVPLARTFQNTDVMTASIEGKSILRAVLGRAARERENVFYLPSYELVGALGFFEGYRKDLRHVERTTVSQITDAFFDAFFVEAA